MAVVRFLALVALAASALVGGNVFETRDRLFGTPARVDPAVSRSLEASIGTSGATSAAPAGPRTALRSQPWWQEVTVLAGSASPSPTVRGFAVSDGALQWRVRFRCGSGGIVARLVGSGAGKTLVDGPCGRREVTAYASSRGDVALHVEADGPWEATVEQQVDVPLEEPPTAAMADAGTRVVLRGPLYPIDQAGTGTATVFRLPDGRHALRLEDFYVTPNSDLEVRLSDVASPRTTEEYLAGSSVQVAMLDVTAGSLNFDLPPDVDLATYRSIVFWCERLKSAYAAVRLEPPG